VVFKDSVEYLGHVVDEAGLHSSPRKIEAIKKALRPKELRSFQGMIHYYGKFIPNKKECILIMLDLS